MPVEVERADVLHGRRDRDAARAVVPARQAAFGDLGADAGLRVERGDAGSAGAELLGEGALRRQLELELAREELPLELLVLADVRRRHLADALRIQQDAETPVVDAAVVADDAEVARCPERAAPRSGRSDCPRGRTRRRRATRRPGCRRRPRRPTRRSCRSRVTPSCVTGRVSAARSHPAPRRRAALRTVAMWMLGGLVSISWTHREVGTRRAVRRARGAAAATGDGGRRRRPRGRRARAARRAHPPDGAPPADRPAPRGPRRSGRADRAMDAGTRAVPDGHGRGIPLRHHLDRPRHRALARGADRGERVPLGAPRRRDRVPAAGGGELSDPLVRAVGGRAVPARRGLGGAGDPRVPAAPRCGRLLRAASRAAASAGARRTASSGCAPGCARRRRAATRSTPGSSSRAATASAPRSSRARGIRSGR